MMMPGSSSYDWEAENRRTLQDGYEALSKTSQSIARSQQVALETEQLGTEVISDLHEQRETLLRTKNRLTDADDGLAQSRNLLRRMSRNILYNKLILIIIIILEIAILGSIVYLKFFKPKK